IHAMLVDEFEDHVGGAARELDQALAALGAIHLDDFVGIEFEARDHLAAVASGGTPAGLAGLENNGPDPTPGKMQRRREPPEPAADDAHVSRDRFVERWCRWSR